MNFQHNLQYQWGLKPSIFSMSALNWPRPSNKQTHKCIFTVLQCLLVWWFVQVKGATDFRMNSYPQGMDSVFFLAGCVNHKSQFLIFKSTYYWMTWTLNDIWWQHGIRFDKILNMTSSGKQGLMYRIVYHTGSCGDRFLRYELNLLSFRSLYIRSLYIKSLSQRGWYCDKAIEQHTCIDSSNFDRNRVVLP